MIAIKYTVFTIFFLLELCALAAFSFWGFHLKSGWVIKILAGIGLPLVVAIFWGAFIAPKASFPVPSYGRILLQLLIFSLACAALYLSDKGKLAFIFGTVVALEMVLMYFFDKTETGS